MTNPNLANTDCRNYHLCHLTEYNWSHHYQWTPSQLEATKNVCRGYAKFEERKTKTNKKTRNFVLGVQVTLETRSLRVSPFNSPWTIRNVACLLTLTIYDLCWSWCLSKSHFKFFRKALSPLLGFPWPKVEDAYIHYRGKTQRFGGLTIFKKLDFWAI